MIKTYKAHLKNNRLEWSEPVPATLTTNEEVEVRVTVFEETQAKRTERAQRMVALLETLARGSVDPVGGTGTGSIADPVAWQREQRMERWIDDLNVIDPFA